MKTKHNKKRNTAFLYEALVRELTKCFVSKDKKKSQKIRNILKEHFKKGAALAKELECYNALESKSRFDHYTAEKMIFRARASYDTLDKQEIFKEQSDVIDKINKTLGKEVYNNFVPNYKVYATLSQIFGDKLSVKARVLMEQQVLDSLIAEENKKENLKPVDSLVVKSFTKRFNEQYKHLLPSQRRLLENYITSFGPNNADFRMFIGNELKLIKEHVEKSLTLKDVQEDNEMIKSTKKVLDILNTFNVSNLQREDIIKILKLQKLVSEYEKNDD
jgi:hypothetical protein